jgi:hypothetical protein
MFAIPRRYNHFIFAVIQAGLTCLIAAWNCQLAVGDNGPIPCSLAIIVGYLLGNDVAGRCAGGPLNSICFFSSDQWRVGPLLDCGRANKMRLCPEGGHCREGIHQDVQHLVFFYLLPTAFVAAPMTPILAKRINSPTSRGPDTYKL